MMRKPPTISDEERDLFRTEVGKVRPIKQDKLPPPRPAKKVKIRRSAALKETMLDMPLPSMAGESSLTPLQADDILFFNRPGLQSRELQTLRRGDINIEAKLDLHGFTIEQAHQALHQFLAQAKQAGYRYLLVIHGKGGRSQNTLPALKNRVNFWLREYPVVLAFCSAKPAHGGAGAVYVRLKTKAL